MHWFHNWGTETAQNIKRKELPNDKWLLLDYKIQLKKHQGNETHCGMRNTSPEYKDLLMRQVTDLSLHVLATKKTSLTPQWDLIQKKLLCWPADSSCAELIPKQGVLKPETYEDFDCFLSFLTPFPPVDERRIELKLPATVQNRTDVSPFLGGFWYEVLFWDWCDSGAEFTLLGLQRDGILVWK